MIFKIIFTWWNKQTFGTFLKTLFFGKYVGSDEYGNKYYKSKKNERWVIYSKNIEATKITSDWYLWIHHTIDKIPDIKDTKFSWQKKHLENQTGTRNRFKPVKISKDNLKKNMKLGSKLFFLFLLINSISYLIAEENIVTTPLINVDEIKPSFENLDESNESITSNKKLKEKRSSQNLKSSQAVLIGLDKITAKSIKLIVNLNESKQFGPLEIKILKCGKVKVNNRLDSVAYMQVKDLTKNENEQVFIFNGWTFASDPTLTPFDHAIYDLQLLNCNSA